MFAHLRAAGARIVEMVWQDLKPRDIVTAGAVRNAVQVVLALSGSINCVKHLQAIATEADVDIDVYQTFSDYADRVPLLAAVRPNGPGLIEEFEAAGGARAVLKRLERQLDLDARSVGGGTLREILAGTRVADERVISDARHAAVEPARDRYRARQPAAGRRHRTARRHRRAHAVSSVARQISSIPATRPWRESRRAA